MRQQPFQQQYVHRQLPQQQQPHQQQYVRQQEQLLQPHRSSHHASPKYGIGGPFDCGSNATGWYQEESPPPPNSPMGSVYQCKRCRRLEHMAQICTTPQRFEGTCNSCGQYGHRYHNCITNTYHNTHAHANVISYPNGFSRRGSGNMLWPRQQQQQQPIVNGTMPWPQQQPQQQQQQQQPRQQPISYDSDSGWVRGVINGGAGVLPPSGNGGDSGGKHRYTAGHSSVDISGGGSISGGNGDDGYTLVAGGSGPPPNWAVEERQDGGDYTEDDSGLLVGPFGTPQDVSAEDSIIFPTLGPGLHVLARPQQQQRPPPHSMGAGGGAGAVEHQRAQPQQLQRPPHSMGAGGGAGVVEYQRAWPQQQQRPPQLMGAGDDAGAMEHQRARPHQQQRPPHSMEAGGDAAGVEYHKRSRSSNSGRRRIQWEPESGQGRRRHSNSGSRRSRSWNHRC